jgi:hypothetical protein
MTQANLFDAVRARAARDEAIERVEVSASPEWKARARSAVLRLADELRVFTTDDVWRVIPKPREPRALGAVMQQLARAGRIKHAGWAKSAQVSRHHTDVKTWSKA